MSQDVSSTRPQAERPTCPAVPVELTIRPPAWIFDTDKHNSWLEDDLGLDRLKYMRTRIPQSELGRLWQSSFAELNAEFSDNYAVLLYSRLHPESITGQYLELVMRFRNAAASTELDDVHKIADAIKSQVPFDDVKAVLALYCGRVLHGFVGDEAEVLSDIAAALRDRYRAEEREARRREAAGSVESKRDSSATPAVAYVASSPWLSGELWRESTVFSARDLCHVAGAREFVFSSRTGRPLMLLVLKTDYARCPTGLSHILAQPLLELVDMSRFPRDLLRQVPDADMCGLVFERMEQAAELVRSDTAAHTASTLCKVLHEMIRVRWVPTRLENINAVWICPKTGAPMLHASAFTPLASMAVIPSQLCVSTVRKLATALQCWSSAATKEYCEQVIIQRAASVSNTVEPFCYLSQRFAVDAVLDAELTCVWEAETWDKASPVGASQVEANWSSIVECCNRVCPAVLSNCEIDADESVICAKWDTPNLHALKALFLRKYVPAFTGPLSAAQLAVAKKFRAVVNATGGTAYHVKFSDTDVRVATEQDLTDALSVFSRYIFSFTAPDTTPMY